MSAGWVRRARAEDIESIVAIDAIVNPTPWPRSRFVTLMGRAADAPASLLVCEDVGRVCGYLVYNTVLDESTIENIGIRQDCQRRGMARKLVSVALDQMLLVGIRRCLLEVRVSNTPARGLYDALGFVHDGVRKNYYRSESGPEDACLMSLDLQGEHDERA